MNSSNNHPQDLVPVGSSREVEVILRRGTDVGGPMRTFGDTGPSCELEYPWVGRNHQARCGTCEYVGEESSSAELRESDRPPDQPGREDDVEMEVRGDALGPAWALYSACRSPLDG